MNRATKLTLTLLVSLLLSNCTFLSQRVKLENGVSKDLAESRSKTISNVEYTLHFIIPSEKDIAVKGNEILQFQWKGTDDLQIDFQADSTQLDAACIVNGETRKVRVQDEHIIIYKKWLKEGKNEIRLSFRCGDAALNRNDDYLYTLFVPDHARSVFPCFDQPDLKAKFHLSLDVPEGWKTMSSVEDTLIPTYLFSFVVGNFQEQTAEKDGRIIRGLYRETDKQKVAQMPIVFDEIALSLRWMEEYTGIPYPFDRYGFVVIPGYQFGGMEHPGAIQFADWEIFLSKNATPDEELVRLNLIAHETSHMWFGDLVTMRWFSDVWTKEVFANFMASKIAEQQFPDIHHQLNFLKDHYISAYAVDRTKGTHPIQQELENLNQAGLLYGNIIYHKAPVMMRKLEEQMGEEAFRIGLQRYLKQFTFGNAAWDELIQILHTANPKAKVKEFDKAWVKEKGMPILICTAKDGKLIVTQSDPYKRGIIWKQKFMVALGKNDSIAEVIEVNMQKSIAEIPIDIEPDFLIPNYDGSGYGQFLLDEKDGICNATKMEEVLSHQEDALHRFAIAMTLYENYLLHRIHRKELFNTYFSALSIENNPLMASTLCSYINHLVFDSEKDERDTYENQLWELSQTHELQAVRQQLLRSLSTSATNQHVVRELYYIWYTQNNELLNERDYMRMAYHLAIMKPKQWEDIIATQRGRIINADRQKEFDFVSRGCTPDKEAQRILFESLLEPENRKVEPYAQALLSLLSSHLREPYNNAYITPGLENLIDIQKTSDIFFPGKWCSALLGNHKSKEAKKMVEDFLASHKDYPFSLKNKILQESFSLFNEEEY